MNPNDSSELNVTLLFALRRESDALRLITDHLKVKEMGPADHIRTKHEAKAFMESGDVKAAEELLKLAKSRRQVNQSESMTIAQRQGQKLNP
jgi:hypothetical protein